MRGRWAYTIVALVAAAMSVAGCGGETATAPTATEAGSTPPTVTEAGAATTVAAGTEPATTAPAETATAGGERVDATVTIEHGEPVGGPSTVEAKRDDRVRIVVRADAEDELHLHGYDLERTVRPGKPAVFDFVAELEGIFELESHHAGALVAKVVVEP